MKKLIGLGMILALVVISFFLGRHFYIKSTFTKPYSIVEEVVKDAKDSKNRSEYLISDGDWSELSENSIYKLVREPLQWTEFTDFINGCEGPANSLSTENGNATDKVMRQKYKEKHRTIGVTCHGYDIENGQHIGTKTYNLLLENVNGSWRIVGRAPIEGDNIE
ncbi:hypothetical protein LC085_13615 [Bacillus tianshenii]|uniref:hypothetical protein n=1 Tax=Sutcliffiella tianshenii TaxID=1463404 RepID=UPI001CD1C7DD|nr:hypothetical protein [Bacillus tianshenii]MCA1320954.1 hypothetical protein [Bacillus tianshenii]